jgi:Ca2+-transporting ATPase
MPAHILFLQLIIDPSCSLVFEAEEAEQDAMRIPPRRSDDRLFDTAVLMRGLWQGSGLLALLCGVYVWVRHVTQADDIARATTFAVLVFANLGLIYVNRTWNAPSWRGHHGTNRYFNWMALGAVALLAIVLFVPEAARLFSFMRPSVSMLFVAAACAVLGTLWFEAVKWQLQRRKKLSCI